MQIVIEIPEVSYISLRKIATISGQRSCKTLMSIMLNAVANGTPLPKGHGRLIDADKIVAEATKGMKYPQNYKYMECVIAHINLAPTIIEADKESEE